MFFPFLTKIRKFKMGAIFREGNIFGKLPIVNCFGNLWVENFKEIALSRTVKEIEANLCFFAFLAKIRKFKMAAIFGEKKFFWGRKFR